MIEGEPEHIKNDPNGNNAANNNEKSMQEIPGKKPLYSNGVPDCLCISLKWLYVLSGEFLVPMVQQLISGF